MDQGRYPTKMLKIATKRAKDLLSAFCRTTVHMLTSLSSKRKELQELGTVITPLSSGETEVR